MANYFVYERLRLRHHEQQQVDALWQQKSDVRGALDHFILRHEI